MGLLKHVGTELDTHLEPLKFEASEVIPFFSLSAQLLRECVVPHKVFKQGAAVAES